MKQVNFPQCNTKDSNNKPIAITEHLSNVSHSTLHTISKFIFNKDEIRFIRENKYIWVISKLGENPPAFAFQNPFTTPKSPFKAVDNKVFIYHQILWQEHNFLVLLSRDYNNSKAKVRWFSITMDGDWVKAGNIPQSLQSEGKGWLKKVLMQMVEEYEHIMTK